MPASDRFVCRAASLTSGRIRASEPYLSRVPEKIRFAEPGGPDASPREARNSAVLVAFSPGRPTRCRLALRVPVKGELQPAGIPEADRFAGRSLPQWRPAAGTELISKYIRNTIQRSAHALLVSADVNNGFSPVLFRRFCGWPKGFSVCSTPLLFIGTVSRPS